MLLGISPVYAQTSGTDVPGSVPYDTINPRHFGAIGDGFSHPLSGITAFGANNTNTTGWTLTQWQTIFPTATSIGNEVDGVAINAAIQYMRTLPHNIPGYFVLPAGYYYSDVSINMTGFRGAGKVFDFKGSYLHSTATGKIDRTMRGAIE